MQPKDIDINHQAECFEKNAPELLNHIYSKVKWLGQQHFQLDDDKAKQLAITISKMMVEDFGGEIIYIPKGIITQLSGRDMAIFNEFNGHNHAELARKYNVSTPWVYTIIKRVHKQQVAKRQIDLFEEKE